MEYLTLKGKKAIASIKVYWSFQFKNRKLQFLHCTFCSIISINWSKPSEEITIKEDRNEMWPIAEQSVAFVCILQFVVLEVDRIQFSYSLSLNQYQTSSNHTFISWVLYNKVHDILCFNIKESHWSILISALKLCGVYDIWGAKPTKERDRKNLFHFIHNCINEIHLLCSSNCDKNCVHCIHLTCPFN